MEYTLKNGKTVTIRPPQPEDAPALVALFQQADTETRFLSREPGEFDYTVEQEAELARRMLEAPDRSWFAVFLDGKLVGQSSAALHGSRSRFRHRAGVGFVLLKEYWGMGIGGKMMETCLAWCREHGAEQVELEVVANNYRALQMYLSFGFKITGRRPNGIKYADGTYADEYQMVKQF